MKDQLDYSGVPVEQLTAVMLTMIMKKANDLETMVKQRVMEKELFEVGV